MDKLHNDGHRFLHLPATMQFIILLSKAERNIFNVVTKNDDAIDLVFGDGNFANMPLGSFRLYYRVSDNAKYAIQPADLCKILDFLFRTLTQTGDNKRYRLFVV